jgi:hypothetical protein
MKSKAPAILYTQEAFQWVDIVCNTALSLYPIADTLQQPKQTTPTPRPAPSSSFLLRNHRTPYTATPFTITPGTGTSSLSTHPVTLKRTSRTLNTARRPLSTAWYLIRRKPTSTAQTCGQTGYGVTERSMRKVDWRQWASLRRLLRKITPDGSKCTQVETICMR